MKWTVDLQSGGSLMIKLDDDDRAFISMTPNFLLVSRDEVDELIVALEELCLEWEGREMKRKSE